MNIKETLLCTTVLLISGTPVVAAQCLSDAGMGYLRSKVGKLILSPVCPDTAPHLLS
jgi:hypothetical protein